MGAWIEISTSFTLIFINSPSHPTMGAWIEINRQVVICGDDARRTPRWVRGLKSILSDFYISVVKSHPTMGAWIEIALL